MRSYQILAAILLVFISSLAAASGKHPGGHGNSSIGKPGKIENVTRTITVNMYDSMRYEPAYISVRQGETIRFRVVNSGKIKHELVLGNESELVEHYEIMKKNPEMEHEDENMITLQPGASGDIVWQFTNAGKVGFACLLPGHYEAGMKGVVSVKSKQAKRIKK